MIQTPITVPTSAPTAAVDAAVWARQGRQERNEVRFLAPCHDDHHPSARWNPEKKTWHCDVCKTGGGWVDLAKRLDVYDLPGTHTGTQKPRIVATYDYCDRDGSVLYQAVRYEPKDFRQRKPDGAGGWLWRLDNTPRVPYRLPELLAADPDEAVYICEGEKDVERLRARGLVATTNVGGAGKWRADYSDVLRGRRVVVLPDNDDAGHQHAARVAQALDGIAAEVRVLTLPGLPPKGDVSDWLDAGGAVSDLPRLAEEAPTADVFVSSGTPSLRADERKITVETARELAAAAPEQPDWLASAYLAGGAVTELTGLPKSAGKTTLAAFLIRSLVRGESFLGRPTQRTGVMVLTEQTPTTLRESLDLAGLLERDDVGFVRWHAHRGIPFVEVVAQAAAECLRRGWRVLVIDTIGQWAGIQGDSENHSGSAMAAMEPVQDAAGLGLAVLVIRHDRKSGGEVGQSGRGSNAFSGAVDIVLQLGRPEGNAPPTHRVLNALSRFRETPQRVVIDLTPDGYVCLGDVQAVVAHGIRESILDRLPTDPEKAWTFEQVHEACPPDAHGRTPGRSTVHEVLMALTSSDHGLAHVGTATLPTRGKPKVYWRSLSSGTPSLGADETNEDKRATEPIHSSGTTGHPDETNRAPEEGALCVECSRPSNALDRGRPVCFSHHPMGTSAPVGVA